MFKLVKSYLIKFTQNIPQAVYMLTYDTLHYKHYYKLFFPAGKHASYYM